jgi:alkylhydroperoxidase family enzyme
VEREPRVARLDREAVADRVRDVFEAFVQERGKVPNLFRVAAHRPEIVATLRAHMNAVMGPGTVDVLLKELIAVIVSQINNCEY